LPIRAERRAVACAPHFRGECGPHPTHIARQADIPRGDKITWEGHEPWLNRFFDHPTSSGHHAPIRFEADAPDLIIEGKLPEDLAGIFYYYADGPDPLYPPREGDYHWFDGDGMVSAFEFADGRVSMRDPLA
jgi:hypothetical protein